MIERIEVDILVGGSEHDLLDQESQADWLARLEAGVCAAPPTPFGPSGVSRVTDVRNFAARASSHAGK